MGWEGRIPRARAELWLSCRESPFLSHRARPLASARTREGNAGALRAAGKLPCVFLLGWGELLPAGHGGWVPAFLRCRGRGQRPALAEPARPLPTPSAPFPPQTSRAFHLHAFPTPPFFGFFLEYIFQRDVCSETKEFCGAFLLLLFLLLFVAFFVVLFKPRGV